MKIRINKNRNKITFYSAYYDFSMRSYHIYFSCYFEEFMEYNRNWIYDENIKNEKKEIIEMGHKKYIK